MVVRRAETLPIRTSEDVVARAPGGPRAAPVELGFSLVDQTKIVTAASELARNTRRRTAAAARCGIEALHDGDAARAARWSSRTRARHRRHRAGAAGRLHDRRRARARPRRRQAAVERVRDRVARRRGHAGDDRAVEMSASRIAVGVTRSQRRRGGAPARRRRSPRKLRTSTRPTSAAWRSSSPRWRPTSSSTPAAASSSCRACAIEADARRRRDPRARPRAGHRATSTPRCATAISTAGTRRHGPRRDRSGIVRRFDIYSTSGERHGRARRAAAPARTATAPSAARSAAGRRVPKPGEEVCGDAWACRATRGRRRRSSWSTASATAPAPPRPPRAAPSRLFRRTPERAAPRDRSSACTTALRPRAAPRWPSPTSITRRERRRFAGVGNIAGDRPRRRRHAQPGLAPRHARPRRRAGSRSSPTRGPPDATLRAALRRPDPHWNLDAIPGLSGAHPGLIAGVLYRDFRRGRDDVTVVVREPRHVMSLPLLSIALRARARRRPRAAARAPDRRAARLRRPGPDAHRHRRSEIARNAFRVRAAAAGSSSRSRAAPRRRSSSVRDQRQGPRHPRPRHGSSTDATDRRPAWASACRRAPARWTASTIESASAGGTTVVAAEAPAAAGRRSSRPDASTRIGRAAGAASSRPIRSRRSSSRTRSCSRALERAARRQDELVRAQPRARGHQPRRGRALRRARRAGRPPAARRRAQVAVPLEHEPRVPDAAELDPGADAGCCSIASTAS